MSDEQSVPTAAPAFPRFTFCELSIYKNKHTNKLYTIRQKATNECDMLII